MRDMKSVQNFEKKMGISKDLHENALPSSGYDAAIPCKSQIGNKGDDLFHQSILTISMKP
jgi:hypothetical protein